MIAILILPQPEVHWTAPSLCTNQLSCCLMQNVAGYFRRHLPTGPYLHLLFFLSLIFLPFSTDNSIFKLPTPRYSPSCANNGLELAKAGSALTERCKSRNAIGEKRIDTCGFVQLWSCYALTWSASFSTLPRFFNHTQWVLLFLRMALLGKSDSHRLVKSSFSGYDGGQYESDIGPIGEMTAQPVISSNQWHVVYLLMNNLV